MPVVAEDQPVRLITRAVDGALVVRRAFARIGRAYSLLGYNCQDFAREALFGTASSPEREGVVVLGLLAAIVGGGYAAMRPTYDPCVDRHRDRRGRFARR
jgi:hypothetical protein